jgi:NitT/TauT family transport system substrate-binding protein
MPEPHGPGTQIPATEDMRSGPPARETGGPDCASASPYRHHWGLSLFGTFAALAGLALLTGCGASSTPGSGAGADGGDSPVQVKVAAPEGAATAPLYIALEEGYFADAGLDVELVPIKASSDIPALLATGDVDFGTGQPNATFYNAVASGIDDPVVLATNAYDEDTRLPGLMVRTDLVDDREVSDAGDLGGRTVAVIGPSTSSQYFAEAAIRGAGGDPSRVEFTVMGLPDMLSALSNGKIDAAWMFEPLASTAIAEDIAVPVAGVGEVAPGFPTWLQASEQIVSSDPEAVEAFVGASIKALEFYDAALEDDRRDEIIQVLTQYTSMDDAADWEDTELPTVSTDGAIQAGPVDAFQQYLVDGGVIETVTPASEYVDDSFRQASLDPAG